MSSMLVHVEKVTLPSRSDGVASVPVASLPICRRFLP